MEIVKPLKVNVVLASIIFYSTTSATNYNFDPSVRIWEIPSIPGQLLRTLDLVTDTRLLHLPQTVETTVATALTSPVVIQKKFEQLSSSEVAGTNAEQSQDNDDATYHYDHAYEELVRRYFGSSAENADEAAITASLKVNENFLDAKIPNASTKKKCRKVRRKHQDCEICQNFRNGEKSEKCSYSTESEPQRYSYNKERNYRSRKSQNESAKDDEGEPEVEHNNNDNKVKKTKAKVYFAEMNAFLPESKNSDSSTCIKKTKRHIVCYYCEHSCGQNIIKCYARNNESNSPPLASSGGVSGSAKGKKAQKVQKTKHRVYKRTVTHSTWSEGK